MTDLPGGAGERGPLPPHERTWRHPSELAAPPLEPTTRGGRVLIISTATVSLLLVGVLALLMTPGRTRNANQDADVGEAIVTDFVTFAPAAGSPDVATTVSRIGATPSAATAADATDGGRRATAPASSVGFVGGQSTITASLVGPTISIAITGAVVVTPLGDGLAVTTESAVDGAGGSINAVLPNGEAVIADVVVVDEGVVFVAIAGTDDGMALAGEVPPSDGLYLSIGGTTTPVDSTALATMVIPEATPVLDDDGDLVGLCTYGPDGIEVVPVGTLPELPVASTVVVDSAPATEPAQSSAPVSVAPTTHTGAPESDPDPSSPTVTTAAVSTSTSSSTTSSVPGR